MYNSKTALYHVPRPFPTARYLPTAVPHCLLPPTYTTLWIRLLKDGDGFLSTRWYPKVYIKKKKKISSYNFLAVSSGQGFCWPNFLYWQFADFSICYVNLLSDDCGKISWLDKQHRTRNPWVRVILTECSTCRAPVPWQSCWQLTL